MTPSPARPALDAIVVGAGPERPRRGPDPGPCRSLGPGLRGGADDRWRDTDRGADAPRVPPRRVLHDRAADAGLAVLPDDRLGRPRRRARPPGCPRRPRARRRAGGVLERSFIATAAGLDVDRRTDDGVGLAPALRAARPGCREAVRRAAPARSSTCRAIRWRWPGSGCRRCAPPTGWRGAGSAGEAARALFAGLAAHSMVALDRPLTASFGLVLGMYAHAVGWPMVRGGVPRPSRDALAAELRRLGGEIVTGAPGRRPGRPARRPASCCSTRRRGPSWPSPATGSRRARGAGVRAIPLRSRACSRSTGRSTDRSRGPPTACARAATVHLGGTLEEVARSERQVAAGRHAGAAVHAARPVPPVGSVARARPARRRPGRTATCPSGSDVDMTDRIEAQVERFAPGFRDRILGRGPRTRRPSSRRTTRTTSAATSTPASRTSASCSSGRRVAPRSVPRRPGPVPLLVVDAARRRRPRDERLPRGAVCAAPRPALGRRVRPPSTVRIASPRSHQPSHSAPTAGMRDPDDQQDRRARSGSARRSAKLSSTTPPRRSSATAASARPSALQRRGVGEQRGPVALEVGRDRARAGVSRPSRFVAIWPNASATAPSGRRAEDLDLRQLVLRPSRVRSAGRRPSARSGERPAASAPASPRRTSPSPGVARARSPCDRGSRRCESTWARPVRRPRRTARRPIRAGRSRRATRERRCRRAP